MLFHRMTEDQKSSFLAMATKMLLADGQVAPEEERLLDMIRSELGGDVRAKADEIHGPVSAEAFDTKESKVVATLGFLVMGFIDSKFHVDESAVFEEVCDAFGLAADEVERLRDWAGRHAEMLVELDRLIADT